MSEIVRNSRWAGEPIWYPAVELFGHLVDLRTVKFIIVATLIPFVLGLMLRRQPVQISFLIVTFFALLVLESYSTMLQLAGSYGAPVPFEWEILLGYLEDCLWLVPAFLVGFLADLIYRKVSANNAPNH